eukprot:TRINITY_DN1437_c0_g1_i1.p1 TRINITY_DN1437_c0_g1~~TRINITY_DN1437_c0_g1_i1.p1  ORF type:complete len:558 (+),score=106.55 TRINITY_DN1437_c0_g1_i1:191-1675(+)
MVTENDHNSVTICVTGENLQFVFQCPEALNAGIDGDHLLNWNTAELLRQYSNEQFEISVQKYDEESVLYSLHNTTLKIKSVMGTEEYKIGKEDIRNLTEKFADDRMEFLGMQEELFKKAFFIGMFQLVKTVNTDNAERVEMNHLISAIISLLALHVSKKRGQDAKRDLREFVMKHRSHQQKRKWNVNYSDSVVRMYTDVFKEDFHTIAEDLKTHNKYFLNSDNWIWIAIQKMIFKFQNRFNLWQYGDSHTNAIGLDRYISKLRVLLAYVDNMKKKHVAIPDRAYELEKELCGAIENVEDFEQSFYHFVVTLAGVDEEDLKMKDSLLELRTPYVNNTEEMVPDEESKTIDRFDSWDDGFAPHNFREIKRAWKHYLHIDAAEAKEAMHNLETTHEEARTFLREVQCIHCIRDEFMFNCVVAVTGLKNAGKSTVFRDLWNLEVPTGLHQSTTGVSLYKRNDQSQVVMADFPGYDDNKKSQRNMRRMYTHRNGSHYYG